MTDAQPSTRVPLARRLGKQAAFVALGNAFTLAVGFPLQIYVSRVLGADGLGVFSLIEGAVLTIAGFLSLGLAQTAVRFIPMHLERGEYDQIRRLVRVGVIIILCAGATGFVLLLASLDWIGDAWPELAAHKHSVALMGAMIPLTLLLFFLKQALRGFQEIRYMIFGSSVVQLAVKAGTTVALFSLGWLIDGYAVAVVLASLCAVLWMAHGLHGRLAQIPASSGHSAPSPLRQWRRFAAFSAASGVQMTATRYLDRFLLGIFVNSAGVGVFYVVRGLQALPMTFQQMLLMVGAPMFAAANARGDTDERQRLFHLMTDWAVRGSFPIIVFLVLFADPFLDLFGEEFASDGADVMRVLAIAQFLDLACGPVGNVAWMGGLERNSLRIESQQAGLTSFLMLCTVPWFGLAGAAMAFAVGVLYVNVRLLVLVRRHLHIGWWDRRYLGWLFPGSATLVAGGGLRLLGRGSGLVELVEVIGILYAVFAGASLLAGLRDEDKELVRAWLAGGG